MTIRTGKSGRYRYYACSIKARQGETGCKGRAIPMDKLDGIVASHIQERLLDPDRLEETLATVLGRRQEQSERRRQHIAELNRRAAESELRLKRLYDAIEAGVADLDDPALKERIVGLKVIRDQSKLDAERAEAMLDSAGHKAISPAAIRRFSEVARERIRLEGGGYRRDHLRALGPACRGRRRRDSHHGIKDRPAEDACCCPRKEIGGYWRAQRQTEWQAAPDDDEHYVYAIAL